MRSHQLCIVQCSRETLVSGNLRLMQRKFCKERVSNKWAGRSKIPIFSTFGHIFSIYRYTFRDRRKLYVVMCSAWLASHWPRNNDLEWPWMVILHWMMLSGSYIMACASCVLWSQMRVHCQQQKCSSWTLASGDVRFVRLFAKFPGYGA